MGLLYLGLGTNLGNKLANIEAAMHDLAHYFGPIIKCSAFYESKPWGFHSENDFLNAVAIYSVDVPPIEILRITQQIETDLGRKNKTTTQYTDRVIDIDILLIDDQIVDEPYLKIPHPLMAEREFVLLPLAEVAGDRIHPAFKKTFSELKNQLMDKH